MYGIAVSLDPLQSRPSWAPVLVPSTNSGNPHSVVNHCSLVGNHIASWRQSFLPREMWHCHPWCAELRVLRRRASALAVASSCFKGLNHKPVCSTTDAFAWSVLAAVSVTTLWCLQESIDAHDVSEAMKQRVLTYFRVKHEHGHHRHDEDVFPELPYNMQVCLQSSLLHQYSMTLLHTNAATLLQVFYTPFSYTQQQKLWFVELRAHAVQRSGSCMLQRQSREGCCRGARTTLHLSSISCHMCKT